MPRPNRVIGHLSPWVEYADELEAELAELREAAKGMVTSSKQHDRGRIPMHFIIAINRLEALLPAPPETGEK